MTFRRIVLMAFTALALYGAFATTATGGAVANDRVAQSVEARCAG